jgi:hypothetical protein
MHSTRDYWQPERAVRDEAARRARRRNAHTADAQRAREDYRERLRWSTDPYGRTDHQIADDRAVERGED